MGRNCNLELRLETPDYNHHLNRTELCGETQKEKPLTIFYNGEASVCDVTELQARNIIMLASKQVEENLNLYLTPSGSYASIQNHGERPSAFSMKRSLQQFLQKRKHRIRSTSPYNC